MNQKENNEVSGYGQASIHTSRESGFISAGQGAGIEENMPTDAALALAKTDLDTLQILLLEWIAASDWAASQAYLQAHAILLTDLAEHTLENIVQLLSHKESRTLLGFHQRVLHRAREEGIEEAYKEFLDDQPEELSGEDGEVLLQQLGIIRE